MARRSTKRAAAVTAPPPKRRRVRVARARRVAASRVTDALRERAPHVAQAIDWCERVLDGREIAGKPVKQACDSFLYEYEHQGTSECPYVLDERRAEHFFRFARKMPHIKGPLANQGRKFEPQGWQALTGVALFGWIDPATGARRYRKALIEVARGNGKSYFLAIILLYLAFADGESGAEVYSAATGLKQARIVWLTAKEIVRKSPEMRRELGIQLLANAIIQPATASSFIALASEEHSLEGLNPHGAGVDELHAHQTRGVWDVLETALGKRLQSLLISITTAGNDRTGICYEVLSWAIRVLRGEVKDPSFFALLFTVDEGDDWRDEKVWAKANPNLGVSVQLESIRDDFRKAVQVPAAQAAFKMKRLDLWVGARAAYYNIEDWIACGDPSLTDVAFEGGVCVAAMDLATRDDLAPVGRLYWRTEKDGQLHFYWFCRHFISQLAVDDGRNAQYQGWAASKRFTVCDGTEIDFEQIEASVVDDSSRFRIGRLGYDPWQAHDLSQRLAKQGAPMVEVRPSYANFSDPMKELGSLMRTRRIHHDGDPITTWAIGNVVGKFDGQGKNVLPVKEKEENKIDPAVVLLMCLRLATGERAEEQLGVDDFVIRGSETA